MKLFKLKLSEISPNVSYAMKSAVPVPAWYFVVSTFHLLLLLSYLETYINSEVWNIVLRNI